MLLLLLIFTVLPVILNTPSSISPITRDLHSITHTESIFMIISLPAFMVMGSVDNVVYLGEIWNTFEHNLLVDMRNAGDS